MTDEEKFQKFQAIMPKCFFCKANHGGEGYEGYRMGDVVSGIERPDFAYICPGCQSRRSEFATIMSNRRRDFYFRDMLRERKLFEYDEKFSLPNVFPDLRAGNVELFAILDQHPLPCNVWMFGKCGIGKSHVAESVGNRYVETREGAALILGPNIRRMCEEWGAKSTTLIEPYCKVPLLIVDDIDKAREWTSKSLEGLWTIMQGRDRRGLRTIVTSQVTPQVFFKGLERMTPGSDNFSMSILDRLKPLSVFEFQGRPRRGEE